jgi:21S rRNA (GM2251-2'-O)-methyltransferase
MLFIANARGLRVSKCFCSANLPTKRLASLTGAIQRGARKARNVGERTERYNLRPNGNLNVGLENHVARSPRGTRSFEHQDGRRPWRDMEQGQGRRNDKWDQRESRYPEEDHHRSFQDRRPTERFYNKREADGSPFSKKLAPWGSSFGSNKREQAKDQYLSNYNNEGAQDRRSAERSSNGEGYRKPYSRRFDARQRSYRDDEEEAVNHGDGEFTSGTRDAIPLSVPRSSAASEFIYGTSPVKAALQAKNRKLYKLYIYTAADGNQQREGEILVKIAQDLKLKVKRLTGRESQLLDKMAKGRPHNGYVLEASQLPIPPAEALDSVTDLQNGVSFTPGYQSAEELTVNGTSRKILSSSRRYPFVLMLDGIVDPGNLGAIIRSAAFFGVDAIALIDHNLAPFSPVTLKASSGAAEIMRYLKIKREDDFIKRSQSNGWKFFAAVAPNSASAGRGGKNAVNLDEAKGALSKGPCVLMLGGEGDGLRPRLQKAADAVIGIEGGIGLGPEFGLDSLNVSVAAALVMQTFLKGTNARAGNEVSVPEKEGAKDDEKLF